MKWVRRFGFGFAAVATTTATMLHFAAEANEKKQDTNRLRAVKNKMALLAKRAKASPELAHFLKYATVEDDGEMCMCPNDFFRAIGIENPEVAPAIFKQYFSMADTDGNELLTFQEYSFFLDLLSTGEAEFRMAFRLFDTTDDGKISKDEFESILKANTNQDFDLKHYAGLEEKFFGEKGDKKLDYETFVSFLREMKQSVLRAAFSQYENDQGKIDADALVKIITTRTSGGKAKALAIHVGEELGLVTFDDFVAMQGVARDMSAIEKILELYTATGGKINREKFTRALKQASSASTPQEVDLVFRLFATSETHLDQNSLVLFLQATDEQQSRVPMTLPQSMVLGGVSAMIGATVVFPLDKIKTLLVSKSSNFANQNIFSAIKSQLVANVQKEGLRSGLYRGLAPQLIGIAPEKALKLTVNDRLRRWIRGEDQSRDLKLWEEIAAGCGTGLVQVFVSNPIEVVKIRMQIQAQTGVHKSMVQIVREAGFRGLYVGLPAIFLRDIPFNMLYFSSYAGFKKALRDENGEVSGVGVFVSGLGAGAIAAGLDTPADTIKTRLQNGSGQYKNVRHAFVTILKEEGVQALFRGTVPRILIIAPLFSITFLCFEFFQRKFLPYAQPPEFFDHFDTRGLTKTTIDLEKSYGIKM